MKKLSAFILLIFVFCGFIFAEEIKKELSYEHTFETTPSIETVRQWSLQTFFNSEKSYDKESKIITGFGFIPESDFFVNYNFDYKISITGNTVKILFNNFTVGTAKQPFKEGTMYIKYLDNFYEDLEKTSESLFKYCE